MGNDEDEMVECSECGYEKRRCDMYEEDDDWCICYECQVAFEWEEDNE